MARRTTRCRTAALAVLATVAIVLPLASSRAEQPPVPPAAPPFQAQELSIGEPISLPNATPLPAARGTTSPSPAPPSPGQPLTSATPSAAGQGWLGIAIDDTLLTGRLVVVEVAPDSPAAKAGVRQQDVLLAINGNQIQTADEMAAALAAISPGQRVKVAVGRDNKVDDLAMTAAPRPAESMARNWQSAETAADAMPSAGSIPAAGAPPARSATISPPAAPAPADLRSPATVAAVPSQTAPLPPAALASTFPPAASAFGPAASTVPPLQAAPAIGTPSPVVPTAPMQPTMTPAMTKAATAGGRVALGVRTVPVDPGVQSRFHMADARGAFVIGVVEDLPAAKAGVPPGSVIVALNQQPVGSPQELTQLVTRGPIGTPVTLQYVLPGGQSRQASVVLQSLDEPLERALVGTDAGQPLAVPPSLQPAPQLARRPEPAPPTSPAEGNPLGRLETTLRRLEASLQQIDRRLERLESRR